MAAKSIWKGVIQFSLISIPVKVYNALERSENISFNQLHDECLGPIGYEKRCKKCGQVATNDQIVKGYQHEKDQYTVIDPEEIKKITPASNEAIAITGFMKASDIPTAYFDASYFATPEGAVAQQSYALLREVMKRTGLIAVAKVTLKEREELIAISPNETGLLIQKLHYRHEVRSIASMPGALKEETAVDAQQLDRYRRAARHQHDDKFRSTGHRGSLSHPTSQDAGRQDCRPRDHRYRTRNQAR